MGTFQSTKPPIWQDYFIKQGFKHIEVINLLFEFKGYNLNLLIRLLFACLRMRNFMV